MRRKRINILLFILISGFLGLLLIYSANPGLSQDMTDEVNPSKGMANNMYAEENEQCFRCHGEKSYVLEDTILGLKKKVSMCEQNRLDRNEFYNSVHWSFSCTDCHSYDYFEFPHPLSLRFEEYLNCIDCHGYDDNFAKYKFEEIEVDHMKSTHYQTSDGEFHCWNCHDPHSYKLLSRSSENLTEVILESNLSCLKCHGNTDVFELLSDKKLGNIIPQHDWLPNQELHFQSVRCIECHTEVNDSLLIAHNIMSSDSAVRNCVECHSQNSLLMGSLYKFQSKETRLESGFKNGAIIHNNSYVIGANRSRLLNVVSVLLFGLTLLVMAVHTGFRIIHRKK